MAPWWSTTFAGLHISYSRRYFISSRKLGRSALLERACNTLYWPAWRPTTRPLPCITPIFGASTFYRLLGGGQLRRRLAHSLPRRAFRRRLVTYSRRLAAVRSKAAFCSSRRNIDRPRLYPPLAKSQCPRRGIGDDRVRRLWAEICDGFERVFGGPPRLARMTPYIVGGPAWRRTTGR